MKELNGLFYLVEILLHSLDKFPINAYIINTHSVPELSGIT